MIRVGVADYGMYVWEGGLFDYEQRCRELKAIGYDGIERLRPLSESDAIHKSALVRKLGMDYATCLAPDIEHSIQWTAALGKQYVWTGVTAQTFDDFCRQVNRQTTISRQWGVDTALHNHLGSLVETQEQVLEFLGRCPDCKLVLDTAHLAVAEAGDPVYILTHYGDRIAALHVKDWFATDPAKSLWYERGYFCELGGGNVPVPNRECVEILRSQGYSGWILVEHDTHRRDPLEDLRISREMLARWGV